MSKEFVPIKGRYSPTEKLLGPIKRSNFISHKAEILGMFYKGSIHNQSD